jgi:HK97 family phage prohead protease
MDRLFFRAVELDEIRASDQDRSIELSISSEYPVKRFFGVEILRHTPGSIDFSRLNSALLNHNPNVIIGRVINARLDGKKARATIVFDDDQEGQAAFAKVKSGSLKGASIGYAVDKFRQLKEGETWEGFKGPAYVATRFSIVEVSLTPIPADPSVGIGRCLTRSLEGICIERSAYCGQKGYVMQLSNEEYQDLLSRANAVGPEAVVQFSKWVAENQSADFISRKLLDAAIQKRGGSVGGGRKFSDLDDDALARALKNPTAAIL